MVSDISGPIQPVGLTAAIKFLKPHVPCEECHPYRGSFTHYFKIFIDRQIFIYTNTCLF